MIYNENMQPVSQPSKNTTASSGLSSEELNTYRNHGFVELDGRFSADEVAVWQAECDRLLGLTTLLHPDNLRFEFANDKVWKFDPLVDISPVFARLAADPRVLGPLSVIYGGRKPMLFKDKLIYKPAGTRGNGLHQDYANWQGFPTSLITVTIAIDGGTRENGCTEIFAGHTRGLITEPGKKGYMLDPAQIDEGTVRYFESQPGDIALFHCCTPHRAGENRSANQRRQLFLTYNDSADGDLYLAHYWHMWNYRTGPLDADSKIRAYFR
jgi:2-aminoethylphosphonate dioxygenase